MSIGSRTLLTATALMLVIGVPVLGSDQDRDGLRDGFETRWGVTDPHKRDSDGDGVIDSAEDDDHDRLSNLAEQRYGTDPGNPDSDGDGTTDASEDSDGDGHSDAREQDRRPLFRGLRPSLAASRDDVPPRKAHCITGRGDSDIHPCAYGDSNSATTVVLFGDSHAFHWLPALDVAGKRAVWRVVTLAKGSCKSARPDTGHAPRTDCPRWRKSALRWLMDHPPAVVILANAAPTQSRGRKTWQQAIEDTLAALPDRTSAVVLSDTPRPPREVALCMQKHPRNMSACVFTRTSSRAPSAIASEQAAAASGGALFANLFDSICSYDPCPLVQGRQLIYRGVHHLTATISRQLAPSMRRIVSEALTTRSDESAIPSLRALLRPVFPAVEPQTGASR